MRKLLKLILFDLLFWGSIIILSTIAIYKSADPTPAIKNIIYIEAITILPLAIPVYMHNYIFTRFYISKKYFAYIFLTLSILIICSWLYDTLVFKITNGDFETNGFIAIISLGIIHTGLKFLRIGTKHEHKLRLEEAKRVKTESELFELEAKQTKAELELLKNQISPHFLFNTLNSLYSLALENSDQTPSAILKLSDMMRYILEYRENKYVSLDKECTFISNYIELESLRFEEICNIGFDIKGDLNNKIVIPFLFIPFIENCFKHGIGTNNDENKINISIDVHENFLQFKASNKIHSLKKKSKASGVGLNNITRRLAILYPDNHTLEIDKNNEFFNVNLNIILQ